MRLDPDWLVGHAPRVHAAGFGPVEGPLLMLESRESPRISEVARNLVAAGTLDRERLLRWARRALDWSGFDAVKAGVASRH